MKKTMTVFGVLMLVLAITGGAFAAKKLLTGADIKNGSLTGADLKNGSLTGADLKAHSLGVGVFSAATLNKLTGKQAAGVGGPPGPTGATGVTGAASTVAGPAGQNGTNGAAGAKGDKGDKGDPAAAVNYAEGVVLVKRGTTGSFVPWATYSTTLGSPYGNTTSGTFRFTCSAANEPCVVKFSAASTDAGATVYPRALIYKSDINTGQISGQCEYADGADNNNSFEALGALSVGIGGSLDCGSAQAYPTNGIASEIDVPAGYYDVFSTFTFKAS